MPTSTDWRKLARHYAEINGFDPDIFERQMGQEAHGQDLTSPAGAQGPAQIMPATARAWGVKNPHDINEAYNAAAREMAKYTKQYGSVKNALVAYNAGPGRVGGQLPSETQHYIDVIMGGKASPTTRTAGVQPSSQAGAVPTPTGGGTGNLFDFLAASTPTTNPLQAQLQKGWQLLSQLQGQQTGSAVPSAGEAVAGGGISSAGASAPLQSIISQANKIDRARVPYLWGGGHSAAAKPGSEVTPLDCSGAVSRALGVDPRVSGEFAKWGKPGEGKNVTIYANGEHVLMKINGHFWGTSQTNPGGGAGWIPQSAISDEYLKRFTKRHPPGM